LKNKLRAR